MVEKIAFARPAISDEDISRVSDSLRSGWIVSGPEVRAFELELAAFCGVSEAVCVSSWTTGAFLLLKALDIGVGDEVIVPSSTFIASANVIVHAGATPVFVDIDDADWNLDLNLLEAFVTPRTRAVLAVEQLGQPFDISRAAEVCARRSIELIGDCACSLGAKYRGRSSLSKYSNSIVSFHARKVITTGEGGAILTNDIKLANRLRQLRHQGMINSDVARHSDPTLPDVFWEVGYNFRMTDFQAALGRSQLARIDEIIEARKTLSEAYVHALGQQGAVQLRDCDSSILPNFQSFQLLLRHVPLGARDRVISEMYGMGIACKRGVMAVHMQECYRRRHFERSNSLSVSERVANFGLQLPLHEALTLGEVERVVENLLRILGEYEYIARSH